MEENKKSLKFKVLKKKNSQLSKRNQSSLSNIKFLDYKSPEFKLESEIQYKNSLMKNIQICKTIDLKSLTSKIDYICQDLVPKIDNANILVKNIEENINNLNYCSIKKSKNNPEKINMSNGEKENILQKKRGLNCPIHTRFSNDNIKEKIKICFFNSIFDLINKELQNIKKFRPSLIVQNFEKIKPLLNTLKNNKNYINELNKKIKDVFYYTDLTLIKYSKNENYLKEYRIKNQKNKEIINKIEELKNKIDEKENIMIKNHILILDEVFNISLEKMYQFFNNYSDKEKHFNNLSILSNEIDKRKYKKKFKDSIEYREYLNEIKSVATNLEEILEKKNSRYRKI